MINLRKTPAINNFSYANLIYDVTDVNEISQLMISKVNTKNTLGWIVKEYNLNRRTGWFYSITNIQLQDFPILIEKDLYLMTLGHYQLNQAKCYYEEHIAPVGKLTIKLCTAVIQHNNFVSYELHISNLIFLKARIQWRHVRQTK